MSRGFSRRSLLKGLGAAALTAPLWSGRSPRAIAASGRPTRLVVMFTPHGAPAEYFWPTSMTTLTSSKPGDVSILAPLAKYATKLNVLQGLNYVGSNNHPAMHDALTNHTANSIDTVIAKAIGVTPLRSAKSARWMKERLFGTIIPDTLIARMEQAADPAREGVRFCVELIEELSTIPGVAGVHIMAPGNDAAIPEVIEAARPKVEGAAPYDNASN